jgi:hypothetical protein
LLFAAVVETKTIQDRSKVQVSNFL